MGPAERRAIEAQVADLLAERELAGAATLALRGYGPEILSFLSSLHGSRQEADDAFSLFCEALWKGLSGFEGRSSLRTWIYTVARHVSCRVREQRRDRELLVTSSAFEKMAAQVRTTSRTRHKRTRLQRLREQLDPDDQMLLILRIDRELDWNELARVMNEGQTLDDAARTREAARLRKRLQSIKDRLRELMTQDRSSVSRG